MATVIINGRVGKDPQPIGGDGLRFSLASDRWDGKAKERVTDWFSVVVFGDLADRTRKMKVGKGSALCVIGELSPGIWDANDGPRVDLDVRASSVDYLPTSGKQDDGAPRSGGGSSYGGGGGGGYTGNGEDIPFAP